MVSQSAREAPKFDETFKVVRPSDGAVFLGLPRPGDYADFSEKKKGHGSATAYDSSDLANMLANAEDVEFNRFKVGRQKKGGTEYASIKTPTFPDYMNSIARHIGSKSEEKGGKYRKPSVMMVTNVAAYYGVKDLAEMPSATKLVKALERRDNLYPTLKSGHERFLNALDGLSFIDAGRPRNVEVTTEVDASIGKAASETGISKGVIWFISSLITFKKQPDQIIAAHNREEIQRRLSDFDQWMELKANQINSLLDHAETSS
jgi:hypothetical protein